MRWLNFRRIFAFIMLRSSWLSSGPQWLVSVAASGSSLCLLYSSARFSSIEPRLPRSRTSMRFSNISTYSHSSGFFSICHSLRRLSTCSLAFSSREGWDSLRSRGGRRAEGREGRELIWQDLAWRYSGRSCWWVRCLPFLPFWRGWNLWRRRRMMAALYSLGNLLYSLLIEYNHSALRSATPDIAQVLQPLQVQLVGLVRGQDHHVHQRLAAQPAVLQQPLHRSQHFLPQRLQLRARIHSLLPAEVRLSASEEDAHQLHRALHHCHLRSQPLLPSPPPYVDAHLRVVQPLRLLLRRLSRWVVLFGIGRIVLDVYEDSGFAGGSGLAEAEECLVRLVLNAPSFVLEVGLVLGVVEDDLALRVDYLLLKFLQKLVFVPPASGEGGAGAMQQRRTQEEEGQQPLGPY